MFRVSLSMLVCLYVALFLALVLAAWALAAWRRWRHERRALRHCLRCTLCGHAFEDATESDLPRCPVCGHPNERDPFRTL